MWVVWIILVLLSRETSAHPTFVRLGYSSCTGCHVSSQGGGLLTPYGQGIATTQAFIATESEEDESESRYVQAFQGRLMRYTTEDETRTFPMQFDYLAQFKIIPKVWMNGILAVAPKPKDESPEDAKSPYQRLYGREVSATWSIRAEGLKEDRLTLGIGALPMGVGLVDHTAYVRQENRQYVTDLPMTLKYYFARESFFGHAFAYLPNPQEEAGNKETGQGAQGWWRPLRHLALGAQALQGETDTIKRRQGGVLLKAGHGRFAYLGELNRTWRELQSDKSEFRQWTWFQQASIYPREYLHLYASFQGLERDRVFQTRERREAVGFEWRLWSHISLLFEHRTRIAGDLRERSQLLQLYFNGF